MKFIKNLIKKYFSSFVYFYRHLKHRLIVVLFLGLIVGALDAFGLTMFLPLLQLADGSSEVTSEGLGQLSFLVDGLEVLGIKLSLLSALIIIAFFFTLKGIVTYVSEMYKVITRQRFVADLRIKITNLFTTFSYKQFVIVDAGKIYNSLTSEVSRLAIAMKAYIDGIQKIVMSIIYLAFVFLIDWKFAVLVFIGALISNLLYYVIYKKTKEESVQLTNKNNYYYANIIQFVYNFKYLKATGLLGSYGDQLKENIKTVEKTNKRLGGLSAFIGSTREPILIIIVCLAIIFQIYFLNGELSTILISLLLFYRALGQIMAFQADYNNFLSNSGALQNIADFEQELNLHKEETGTVKFERLNSSIDINNINFSYGETEILKEVSLTIRKNETIAFVGESGSGKTTLVNILSGLLKNDKGTVTVDDVNFEQYNKVSYQKRIGYISQEPVIFNDTIFNNVTFWAEPTEDNVNRFNKAIQQASIYKFINELPQKERTKLGDNGINLSGGQRQRISIARELYKDIDILILDEATSALDSETEKEIQSNIDELKGKYTIIIIAHRLSTIKNADFIYIIDKGKIINKGTFEELLKDSIRFRKMVELQDIMI